MIIVRKIYRASVPGHQEWDRSTQVESVEAALAVAMEWTAEQDWSRTEWARPEDAGAGQDGAARDRAMRDLLFYHSIDLGDYELSMMREMCPTW
ncbi:MAG: hypothetical protein ACP5EP_03860 [Acidobacteriaceae bacterium]